MPSDPAALQAESAALSARYCVHPDAPRERQGTLDLEGGQGRSAADLLADARAVVEAAAVLVGVGIALWLGAPPPPTRALADYRATAHGLVGGIPTSAPKNDQRRLKAEVDAYVARLRAGRSLS